MIRQHTVQCRAYRKAYAERYALRRLRQTVCCCPKEQD